MKQKLNSIPLWNRIKLPAKILAGLAFAALVGSAQAQITYTPFLTNVWVVTAGYHFDLTNRVDAAGTTVRGVAISPVTTNVLYSSTYYNTNTGSAHVATVSTEWHRHGRRDCRHDECSRF
jgi:TRAP-type C4-dicarboxylate transport system permease large subunit